MISVIAFEPKYADDFKQLNLEWLNKFGLTEAADLMMLNNVITEINPVMLPIMIFMFFRI